MRTIGVLGGMSNQATNEYYRLINEHVNRRLGGWNTADVIINSVNFANIESFVRQERWAEAGDYLHKKAISLVAAGADVILCVSNTMHRVSDQFMQGINIPFIHIADPTGTAIQHSNLSTIAILGTKPTMASSYMKSYYKDHFGIEIIAPSEPEQRDVDAIIFNELVKGQFLPASKARYVQIVERLAREGAQGIILGCTEICMLINQSDFEDLPIFDTTSLHAAAAVDFALAD
jgi:aspartate racemase